MPKHYSILVILFFVHSILFGQQASLEDYKVYSALVKTEVRDSAKSVEVIKNLLTKDKTHLTWYKAIKSRDSIDLQLFNFEVRDAKGDYVKPLNDTTLGLLQRYYEMPAATFSLENNFTLKLKVVLLEESPVSQGTVKEWKRFYWEYPSSGGLFQFSNVCYSDDKKTAVFYYWHLRNGLDGHGALAVIESTDSGWQVKYIIYDWQA